MECATLFDWAQHRRDVGMIEAEFAEPLTGSNFSEVAYAAIFATFPPELVERCLKAGCPQDGNVLDPFGGAGTTAVVAAQLGRKATLIELNPEYAILARARIEAAFMGKEEGSRHMSSNSARIGRRSNPALSLLE